jgi:3',5'-cyclic AMP phosphodiesterase CpdA
MLIAQITDLHVVGNGQLCQGRVATNAQLQEAVAHINSLDPRPDVVLATGDLTDHGTAEEYDALREILAALRPPLYLIPGNHDHRDIFLEAFADHAYLPRPGTPFAHYVIEEYPVRLVGLDTTIPGQGYGMLCDERLAWLDATLRAAPHRPTLIFMHHPPFRTGIRWVDAIGLYGGRQMEAIVARHAQVEWVTCGHIHRSIQVAWGGTVACTAPSTSHAQVALTLTETSGFDFGYAIEPRAVQLYLRDPGYGFLSHISYVSGVYETYPSVNASRLRDGFQRRYEELCRTEFDAASPTHRL